jgi:hypothetical protein
VLVDVAVAVAVAVAVSVAVAMFVAVAVAVRVAVAVNVAVGGAAVFVAVAVGEATPLTTSCGGNAPSLELKTTPLLTCGARARQMLPLPVMNEVTSYSVQAPMATAASSSRLSLMAGLFTQVSSDSSQFALPQVAIGGPIAVASTTQRRSVALSAGPSRPATSNRRYDSVNGLPSTANVVSEPKLVSGLLETTRASATGAKVMVIGAGEAIGVGVCEAMSNGVAVSVGSGVPDGVALGVAVSIGVAVGGAVGVGAAVAVSVGVSVAVSVDVVVLVIVSVATDVSVDVGVPVGVSVGVAVSVGVSVGVADSVAVSVGVPVGVD